MKQSLQQNEYAVFSLEFKKTETFLNSAQEIIDYLKQQIETHETATFIAVFDHYSHTNSLSNGQISEDIVYALNIVFCFGITLPDPNILAVRPRSIGVAEMEDHFLVSFMEAPMPVANVTMESWVKSLLNR